MFLYKKEVFQMQNIYLTCINCFTAGESNNPFKNTRSVSLAPALLSNSDTFSRTCWNAAGNKKLIKNCMIKFDIKDRLSFSLGYLMF